MSQVQLRSEQLVIHAILSRPEVIHDIMSHVSADMFENIQNRAIFEVITSLYLNNESINLISVFKGAKELRNADRDSIAMEVSKIQSMFSPVESMSYRDAIGFLIEESVRHEHIDLGHEISTIAVSDKYEPTKVIDIIQAHITHNKFKSLTNKKDLSNEGLLKELDAKMLLSATSDGISGIKTGYNRFDFITSGMQPTNFIVVAARPAMGKTQFALGIMKNASIRNNYKGLFISCEMDEVQVMKRIVSVDSMVSGYSIKRGYLSPEERGKFERSKRRIAKANLKIVAGAFTITDVITLINKTKHTEGLDYVVIDYIQKITAPNAQNRTNEVGEVCRRLKDIANELKIPVIGLAQLSRSVEHRPDKKPILSDLRESGDIEQDADIVAFLYRPSYYMSTEDRDSNPMANDGYVIIAKHRDGDLEDIRLKFDSDVPAWMNPNDTKDEPEEYIQSRIEPNTKFDDECPF
jgi:replicative DNA helicase